MSSHGKRVVGYFELCGKAPRARIIPTAAIPKALSSHYGASVIPSRAGRSSGFRATRPPVRQQDPQKPIQRTQAGATSSVVSSTAIGWRSAIISNTGAVRVRGRRATTRSARFPGIAMKLAYPKRKPPLNLRGSGFEKEQAFIWHQPYETHFS